MLSFTVKPVFSHSQAFLSIVAMARKHTFQTRPSPFSPIYVTHRNGTVQHTHSVGSHPQSKELSLTLDMNKSARTEQLGFFFVFFYT